MSDLRERLAYLQGLANGYNLRDESKEGQILVEMLGVLDQMAGDIVSLQDSNQQLESYVESLDADLSDMENDFYGLDEVVEITCPECGSEIELDGEEMENGGQFDLSCPSCGESLSARDSERVPHSHS